MCTTLGNVAALIIQSCILSNILQEAGMDMGSHLTWKDTANRKASQSQKCSLFNINKEQRRVSFSAVVKVIITVIALYFFDP